LVRSHSAQKLPVVPARAEVARLFAAVHEPRFRTLFRLIYLCGLRIDEAVTPEVRDLREPGQIHLRDAKGNKEGCARRCPRPCAMELRAFWKTSSRMLTATARAARLAACPFPSADSPRRS
jgi:integrase